MSQKTGVGVRSVQRLGYAFRLANVEGEAFETGLKFLNVSIDAAGRGSKADARAFADLGVSIRDARGQLRPTEDVLLDVADKMAALPPGARKTALAMAIFGRSGVDMIPGLNAGGAAIKKMGDEAEAAGAVMSEQAAREADEFNDSVDALKTQVNGLAMGLGTALIPMLTKGVAWTRAWIAANRPAMIAKVTEVVGQLGAKLPALFSAFLAIVHVLGDLARVLGPMVRAIGGVSNLVDGLAALLVGRLVFAVWAAVKAVWGLNGAMLANPIGVVILLIGALILAGFGLAKHWGSISKAWGGFWDGMRQRTHEALEGIRSGFKSMVDAVWNLFPGWLKTLFKVGRYVVRVVGSGLGGGAPAGGGAGGPAPRPPSIRPNLSRAPVAPLDPSASIRVTVSDERAPRVAIKPTDSRIDWASGMTRGFHGFG